VKGPRRRLVALAAGALVACGEPAPPAPVPTPTVGGATAQRPASTDVAAAETAARALWRAVDDYDAKAFAALCVESKDGKDAAPAPSAVEPTLKDLHDKYGARSRALATVARADGTIDVTASMGEGEDGIELTFRRVEGGWRLATIHTATPPMSSPK
jgi:hypothetical protein